jgi:hypothetical protein
MEESGEGVEEVARAIADAPSFYGQTLVEELSEDELQNAAQAAITAVLGTFDLEALKTLVGEIDDVLGGSR